MVLQDDQQALGAPLRAAATPHHQWLGLEKANQCSPCRVLRTSDNLGLSDPSQIIDKCRQLGILGDEHLAAAAERRDLLCFEPAPDSLATDAAHHSFHPFSLSRLPP